MFEAADALGIQLILFAGDLYDQQKSLPTEVVNQTISTFRELFSKYPNIHFVAISGNHDHNSKNTSNLKAETGLTHLATIFDNFLLIDNDYIDTGENIRIHGIPYYSHKAHYDLALEGCRMNLNTKTNLLLIHQTPRHSNPMIPSDVDPTQYGDFDFVFCGHIHKRERVAENFVVVGSPLHRDLGDEGETKGFLIFDTHENDYEFIYLDYPRFERVKLNDTPTSVDNYIIPLIELEEHDSDIDISINDSHNDSLRYYLDAVKPDDSEIYFEIGKSLLDGTI
jgi:DNA repair exonuclease SbcCD nuclease subunit